MRTVVFYENTADATMEKLMEFFPQHQENEDKFVKAGKVIGIGPFSVPGQGAMGTYTMKDWVDDLEGK